jgi:DNA mismatch repair protein MutS
MGESHSLTPMLRQYRALKNEHPEAILLFRLGDFYEMFYEDAEKASRLLDITLTARGRGTDSVAPMCGFPHHQLAAYTAKLVGAGQRVAVCEQVEDPKQARGLVRRVVVRIVTPGTVIDPDQLEAKENAWVAAVAGHDGLVGAAFLDASTGEFLAWRSPPGDDPWNALAGRLDAFAPRELVYPEGFPWPAGYRESRAGRLALTEREPYAFSAAAASAVLRQHLGVASLDGFGLRDRPAAIAAAGGLLDYLQETQKSGLEHIDRLQLHEPSQFLLTDPATQRNLELMRSLRDGGRQGSLIQALDATLTPSGGRLLRRWLLFPLKDPAEINARLDAVEELLRQPDRRRELREILRGTHDIERLLARAVGGTAHARDLIALRASLERLPALIRWAGDCGASLLRETLAGLNPCTDLADRLAGGLADDPPVGLREGGIIRDGFSAELDELRAISRNGRSTIASLEAREREATGIASLKIRFNKVFGYSIEVSKPNLPLVPPHYQRKQTIANGERFITPELKEHEARVLNAQERIEGLEYDVFCALRDEVAARARRLKAAAAAVAVADSIAAFAETAALRDYRRPVLRTTASLRIAAGRHPVVEQQVLERRFVPNDTVLESPREAIAILTGPNMGGKSTYLRQVAVIVMMAQAGSFVPAESAEIGIVDRIFCRAGASDSLAEGQSTFMVEMTEAANILHHATPHSLVLLDEIGRGTSTFDGLSIAWAVVEFLHARRPAPPRTLFATHYHELTELAVELPGVKNCRMAVRESGDEVAFLHRVEPGASDRSYGIQVARLAGVPQPVVERAREILANLERDEYGRDGLPRRARRREGATRRPPAQPELFAPADEPPDPASTQVLAELRSLEPDRTTPLEALERLAAWHRRLRPGG